MERIFVTTNDQDLDLEFEAKRQGKTAQELFELIINADLGTLARNLEGIKKDAITPESQELIAKIETLPEEEKAKIVTAVDVAIAAIVKPVEPVEEVIPK